MNGTDNSKNSILECALRLFAERGYDAVGVSEIVAAAGVTKPTLYYFFQSKEGVLGAVLERYYGLLNELLRRVCVYTPNPGHYEGDVYPVLLRLTNAYFDFARQYRSFYLMVLSMSFSPPTAQATQAVRPYNAQQYKTVIDLFADFARQHGNIKGRERQCALGLIAVINANIGFWYQGYGELDEQTAAGIVHGFMHGIFA